MSKFTPKEFNEIDTLWSILRISLKPSFLMKRKQNSLSQPVIRVAEKYCSKIWHWTRFIFKVGDRLYDLPQLGMSTVDFKEKRVILPIAAKR